MEETNLSTIARKNRREVLGLLLGATFLSSAAFAQKKTPAGTKNRKDVFIIIDEDDNLVNEQELHLSVGAGDNLYIVNAGPTRVFRFEDSPFQQGDCVGVNADTLQKLILKKGAHLGRHHWCFDNTCPPSPCPPRPVNKHGGDITIDQ